MLPLVGALQDNWTIALPCLGANAGCAALKDLSSLQHGLPFLCGAVPIHMYDIAENCRAPLSSLLGECKGSPTFHLGPIEGDILRVEPAGLECPDGLVSGPPCQFVSTLGEHDPFHHPGMLIFNQVLRWIEDFASRQLQFFVVENVKGLKVKYGGSSQSMLDIAVERLEKMQPAFQIRVWNLNAKDYTLAQQRERIYIIGVRRSTLNRAGARDIPVDPPSAMPRCSLSWFLTACLPNTPLHTLAPGQRFNFGRYLRLARGAIRDPRMQGKVMCCDLSRNPALSWGPKFRVDDLVDTLTTANRQLFIISLGEGKKSPTIRRFLHPDERCRLQGFSPDHFGTSPAGDYAKLIGNAFAVPCIGVVLHYSLQVLTTAAGAQNDPVRRARARSRSKKPCANSCARHAPVQIVSISESEVEVISSSESE